MLITLVNHVVQIVLRVLELQHTVLTVQDCNFNFNFKWILYSFYNRYYLDNNVCLKEANFCDPIRQYWDEVN
jgi:hypothetical protein